MVKLSPIATPVALAQMASAQGRGAAQPPLISAEVKADRSVAPPEEGHVWRNWRNYLADFAPQLLR